MSGSKSRKLPRAVRLDNSDIEVFEIAAEPGEWAVPGGFEFLDDDAATLTGKRLQAFKSGFLGIGSFGRVTLVSIAETSEDDYRSAVEQLAAYLLEHYRAPDLETALRVAGDEVRYSESLCEYDIDTLLGLERDFTDDGISERFKKFVPAGVDWEQAKPLVLVKDS